MTTDLNKELLGRLPHALPEGNPAEKVSAILDRPDAEAYLRSLEPDVLFHLIKEAGWDQGVDLIPYVSPEQLQVFFDFDGWRRERFVPARLQPWLAVLVEHAEDDRFVQGLRQVDGEILAMFFKHHMEVFETEEGRIPDEAPDEAVLSPDGTYALVYPDDEVAQALMRALIDRLYELDRVLAWTLLEAVRWELRAEMEEYALRWRTSRLEEYGFVSRQEALAIYRPLDPKKLRARIEDEARAELGRLTPPEELDLPVVVASELDEEFLIARAIHALEDDARAQARVFELTSLLHKVLIADGIEPGEVGSGRQVTRRTLGYLSLGLDYLTRGREELACELLERVTLRELLRAGFTLARQLRHQAQQMAHRPTLGLLEGLPYSLLGPADAALMAELERERPTYARSATEFGLLERTAQIDDVALRLGRIAFKQLWTFVLERMTPDRLVVLAQRPELLNEPDDITFDALFATWLAHRLTQGQGRIEPLDREQVAALLSALRQEPWAEQGPRAHFAELFDSLGDLVPEGTERLLLDWIEETLARMDEELGQIGSVEDALMVRQLLLLHAPR